MPYRTMGRIHADLSRLLSSESGQGTVEYVGLMLLMATLLAGVLTVAGTLKGGGIAEVIAKKLKDTISSVGEAKK